jgi:hypothetical protein
LAFVLSGFTHLLEKLWFFHYILQYRLYGFFDDPISQPTNQPSTP